MSPRAAESHDREEFAWLPGRQFHAVVQQMRPDRLDPRKHAHGSGREYAAALHSDRGFADPEFPPLDSQAVEDVFHGPTPYRVRGDYTIEQHCQCVSTKTRRHQNVRETIIGKTSRERDPPRKLKDLVTQRVSCAPTFEASQLRQLRGRIDFGGPIRHTTKSESSIQQTLREQVLVPPRQGSISAVSVPPPVAHADRAVHTRDRDLIASRAPSAESDSYRNHATTRAFDLSRGSTMSTGATAGFAEQCTIRKPTQNLDLPESASRCHPDGEGSILASQRQPEVLFADCICGAKPRPVARRRFPRIQANGNWKPGTRGHAALTGDRDRRGLPVWSVAAV
ncbi:hypothetical protein GCM10010213_29430 [Microbacterium maritypicum]|uniref:Uncharacterized protein n=1 Tax=Microbacterium maritypicum TaxID=33918 RepID=A0A4Y4B878_MICMQ|nr:hypothetical protein MLI01_29500 [Microbacterium liquefaciens]GGV64169.1 hypothetical protein GCM10010213_29430 [Microbacterium liquefaciens]